MEKVPVVKRIRAVPLAVEVDASGVRAALLDFAKRNKLAARVTRIRTYKEMVQVKGYASDLRKIVRDGCDITWRLTDNPIGMAIYRSFYDSQMDRALQMMSFSTLDKHATIPDLCIGLGSAYKDLSAPDRQVIRRMLPLVKAYECGALFVWLVGRKMFWAERPAVNIEDPGRRLKTEVLGGRRNWRFHSIGTSPSIRWLDREAYHWHGTQVPNAWIKNPKSIKPRDALTWANIEQRRAACEIVGWSKIIEGLNPITVAKHPDPMMGTLVDVDLSGGTLVDPRIRRDDFDDDGRMGDPARFLLVKCGTGRDFAIRVPLNIRTVHEAQARIHGKDPNDFVPPQVRT
jgi:hypothetical protein